MNLAGVESVWQIGQTDRRSESVYSSNPVCAIIFHPSGTSV